MIAHYYRNINSISHILKSSSLVAPEIDGFKFIGTKIFK